MAEASLTASIIIVTLNGLNHLKQCLPAVIEQTYPQDQYEVIIVDNGSTDGTVDYLRKYHPNIRVIENKRNEGFAKPNNQAAGIAKGKFLALLNNDMIVKPTWLAELLATQERSGAECVAGMILNRDGSVDYTGASIDCYGYGYHQCEVDVGEQEIFYACGGSLLIRRDVYLAVGGLDEDFYLYYEDTDLSWRLWLLGYRVVFSPKAQCVHKHNGTSGAFFKLQVDLYADRNHLCMLYKNYSDQHVYRYLFGAMMLRFLKLMEVLRIDNLPEEKSELKPLSWRQKLQKIGRRVRVLLRLTRKLDRLLAQILTIAGFLYLLPTMRQKRQKLQRERKRSDEEIMRMFHIPKNYFNRQSYQNLNTYLAEWRTEEVREKRNG